VYNLADYSSDKRVRHLIEEPTTLNVKGVSRILSFGDGNVLQNSCGLLRVNFDGLDVNLGRGAKDRFIMDLCAPNALLRMRNSNTLQGHFFADEVRSDFNNDGICCGGQCGCFDIVEPTEITLGDTITLSGGCRIDRIFQVLVCGEDCPITSRTSNSLVCAPQKTGTCEVRGKSGTGDFISRTTVTVN
jgi:hypothetical protein